MNLVHLHLVLNHIPVIGTAFALVLMFAAVVRGSEELRRVSLAAVVAIAVVAIPAYLTGEPAGDTVQHLPGVAAGAIDHHEDAASIAFTGLELAGVLALFGLIRYRRTPAIPRGFFRASVLLVIVVSGLMAWTANLGGQIRHPEIGGSSPPATQIERD